MDEIEHQLDKANIVDKFEPVSGDCISIAVAMREKFGGKVVAVVTNSGGSIEHALLKKNDKYYDGRGHVSLKQVVTEFVGKKVDRPEIYVRSASESEIRRYKDGFVYNHVIEALENSTGD